MSFEFYLVLHLIGVFLVLMPLSAVALHVMNGGTRDYPNRKLMAIVHGVGLLIALVAGFGLLHHLGLMSSLPIWVMVKLLIWLTLGVMPFLLYTKRAPPMILLATILLLAIVAATLGVYKPGLGGPDTVDVEPGAAGSATEEIAPNILEPMDESATAPDVDPNNLPPGDDQYPHDDNSADTE